MNGRERPPHPPQLGRWARRAGLAVAGGLVLLAVAAGLVLLWVRAPHWYTGAATKDTATATTRAGILALAAAGLAAAAAVATLTETRRANRAAHYRELQAQLTERYTRTVDQLGSPTLDIRLGGLYALERLAKDSPADQPTVGEVLSSAFVREHTHPVTRLRATHPNHPALRQQTVADRRQAAAAALAGEPLPADVQATLTVLGRLPKLPGIPRADLTGADLSGADLGGADLSSAHLIEADLSGAILGRANLSDADLVEANLSGARLDPAQLTAAEGDEATRLPDGWTRPPAWTQPPAPPADPANPGPPPPPP